MSDKIIIKLYRWAGRWGPFHIRIPCGECALTKDIIADVLGNELTNIPIVVETKDWLTFWWEPLMKGAWHAPIVMVNDKVISQGEALNRGVLIQAVIEQWAKTDRLEGTYLFGKDTCSYCQKAKELLDAHNIEYQYKNVVKSASALYQMIPAVKAHIGNKTPVTVPQIWLDGRYIGGYEDLKKTLANKNNNTEEL